MTTEEMYRDTIGLLPMAYDPELGHNATDTKSPLFDEWLHRVNALGMKFGGIVPLSTIMKAIDDLVADYPGDLAARHVAGSVLGSVLDGARIAQHSPYDMIDFPVFLSDCAFIIRTVTPADIEAGYPNGRLLSKCSGKA